MDKKYLYILIIVIIIAIIAIAGVFLSGPANNNETTIDTNNWNSKELAGIKFKVPEKYSSGISMTGSVIDGKETGNVYESNGLLINVYLSGENLTDRDNEYDSYMKSNASTEIIKISGNDVTIAHNDTSSQSFSVAFFEVGGNQIVIKWDGNTINNEIKAIIASFYELN